MTADRLYRCGGPNQPAKQALFVRVFQASEGASAKRARSVRRETRNGEMCDFRACQVKLKLNQVTAFNGNVV